MPSVSRLPMTADRYVQWGGHLLFTVLMAVGVARAVQNAGGSAVPVIVGATALCAWYLYGVFAISVRHRGSAAPWTLVLIAGWAALTLAAPDFIWLAFVLAMLCWHFVPLPGAIGAELVIAAVAVTAALRTDPVGVGAVIGPLIGIATAIAVTEAVHRVVDAAAARDALSQELAQTQLRLVEQEREAVVIAERARMGSEIHDGAGQALASIVMLLASATDANSPADQQRRQTVTALEMATAALAQTRGYLRGLEGPAAAPDPLADGLRAAVERVRRLGLPAELYIHGDPPELVEPLRSALLRTAQEALANAVRHADASRAVVTLTTLTDEVHLDVVDDGRGFDPTRPGTGSGTGFGLDALRTRVQRCGGTATVDSEPGDGTTVHVCLPLDQGDR
ncbi:MAG: sensor histidine kinase [Gordonia sp. (in: high G+C Gram-positive bacteria)]|uniref:sensor histidine kinase n=1 Tax=Gordonia sp. (in: high G+C Gram-positive bacteria) TaxID=84139 RepID=UPI003BB5004F